MSEGNYLLTYLDEKHSPNFMWFDTRSELSEFIEENMNEINIIDALYIQDCEDVRWWEGAE